MRESVIENYLVERVKALGGEVRKVKWIGRSGAPDRLCMLPPPPFDGRRIIPGEDGKTVIRTPLPRRSRTIWVELKAPGEKAKPHQVREHQRMRKMGQRVEVIDSLEGVDEVLK